MKAFISNAHLSFSGALVTSSLAYFTAQDFHKNSKFVSRRLQESKYTLDNIHNARIYPPLKIEYESRISITETAKDLWDAEIIKGVNWFYNIDWISFGTKAQNVVSSAVNLVKGNGN